MYNIFAYRVISQNLKLQVFLALALFLREYRTNKEELIDKGFSSRYQLCYIDYNVKFKCIEIHLTATKQDSMNKSNLIYTNFSGENKCLWEGGSLKWHLKISTIVSTISLKVPTVPHTMLNTQ